MARKNVIGSFSKELASRAKELAITQLGKKRQHQAVSRMVVRALCPMPEAFLGLEFPYRVLCSNFGENYVIEDGVGNRFTYILGVGWVTTYVVAKDVDGKPCSKAGKFPWTKVTCDEAGALARELHGGHLITRKEYELICNRLVEEQAATKYDVYFDSSHIGNYTNSVDELKSLVESGHSTSWIIGNLDNIAGNCCCWAEGGYVFGGYFQEYGRHCPMAYRRNYAQSTRSSVIGFRVVL